MRTKTTKLATVMAVGLALVGMLSVPGVVAAHEGHHHQAMGTVKSIDEASLVLETTEGKTQTFVLSGTTKYLRGTAAAAREDVVAGERAVVTYESKDGADRALEVKLGEKKS